MAGLPLLPSTRKAKGEKKGRGTFLGLVSSLFWLSINPRHGLAKQPQPAGYNKRWSSTPPLEGCKYRMRTPPKSLWSRTRKALNYAMSCCTNPANLIPQLRLEFLPKISFLSRILSWFSRMWKCRRRAMKVGGSHVCLSLARALSLPPLSSFHITWSDLELCLLLASTLKSPRTLSLLRPPYSSRSGW